LVSCGEMMMIAVDMTEKESMECCEPDRQFGVPREEEVTSFVQYTVYQGMHTKCPW